MSREIDERIVEMTFDNQQFERGVKTTLGTLDKLKKSLKFEGAADGLEGIQNAVNRIDFSNVISGSTAAIAKFTMISNLVTKIQSKAEAMVKSLTIDPVTSGWQKYADITSSTQTIMSATAKDFENEEEQLKVVTEQLDKLNWFTDETSYSLTDMTNNIGKFTSNGVKLETAVTAMEGISTWAAKSGANVGEASRAMYNLSQALATGSVKLIDWKSIENANMATAEFKEQVIDIALAMGTLQKAEDGTIFSGKNKDGSLKEVSVTNFNENLKDEWFTSEVLLKVLDRYGSFTDKLQQYMEELTGIDTTSTLLGYIDDFKAGELDLDKASIKAGVSAERLTEILTELGSAEYELGRKSFKAAQEAKTFQEAIDATKDAVSTGWMKTFQLIFGNYLEAKELWTDLANDLWEIFAAPGVRRNSILEIWLEGEGRTHLLAGAKNIMGSFIDILGAFRSARDALFPEKEVGQALASLTEKFEALTSKLVLSGDQYEKVEEFFGNLLRSLLPVGETIEAVIKGLKPFTKYFSYMGSNAMRIAKRFFDVFSDGAEILRENADIYTLITNKVTKFSNFLVHLAKGPLKLVFHIADQLLYVVQDFQSSFKYFSNKGTGLFKSFGYALKNSVLSLLGRATSLFGDMTGISTKWFAGAASKINDFLNTIGGAYYVIKDVVVRAFRVIKEYFSGVFEKYAGFFEPIRNVFHNIFTWLFGVEEDEAIDALESPIENVADSVERIETAYKSIKDMVLEVIRGDWGNGIDRDNALWGAGYDNDRIQDVVNQVWSLQGAWKEGYEEILESYANVSALMEGATVAGEPKEQKKQAKILLKTKKIVADLGDAMGVVTEAYNEGINDNESAKKRVKFLKKTGQIIEDVSEDLKDRTFLEILKDAGNKFIEKLPALLSKLGAAAATAKIKITELGKSLNEKLGRAVEKLIIFWAKWGPQIKSFFSTIWENLKGFGGSMVEKFGNGWERVKTVFEGVSPIFEKFFTSLLNFDLKGMGAAIVEFFITIGSNIKSGVETALGLGEEGLKKIGGLFGNIFNTAMVLFGGKEVENPEEEMGQLAWLGDLATELKTVTQTLTAETEGAEDAVEGLDASKIMGTIQEYVSGFLGLAKTGASTVTIFRLGTLFKGLGKAGSSLGDFLDILDGQKKGRLWKSIKSVVSGTKSRSVFQDVRDILLGVAAIGFAIVAIGSLPEEDFKQGISAFETIISGLLTIVTTLVGGELGRVGIGALGKMLGAGGGESTVTTLKGVAKALLGLAVACGVMFFAVYEFGQMAKEDSDGLDKGVWAVTKVMGLLTIAIGALSKLNAGSIQFKGVGSTLFALAVAIGVLYYAVSGFAEIKEGLWQGVGATVVIVIALGILLGALAKLSNGAISFKGVAATLIALSFAVGVLFFVVSGFAAFDSPAKLWLQGILGVVAILIALGGAVALINKYGSMTGSVLPKLAVLVVLVIALGALCWAINEWPVNIMQAVAIDLIMGALISFMAAFPKLSQGFKDIKGAAAAGFGVGLSVSAIIGTITATIGLINEIDTLIEEQSGGTRGFKALAKKVGDCIETVGTSIGNAVTSIKTAIGGETAKELVAGQTAAETLKSIIETVAAMYTSHSDFDLFVAWATGGDVTPGTLLEEAFTKLGPGITALVTSVKDLTKADVSKINLLVPFMNSIGQILIDPAMITDILYFMDSVNNLILRLGDINTDSIDSFEKAMGHLADLLTTGITDENAENTGNVLSDALIDFVVYGLQVMADEFNPDLSHDAKERYSDSARNLNLGLQSAIDNVRAGLEFKAKQIPRWIADAINTQVSLVTSAGLNMMLGFKNGMISGSSEVYAVAHSVALKAADRMKATLQERSPSRLTAQIGEYASLGLANGLLNEQSTVEKSAFSVVDGMRSVMTMAGEALSDDLGPVIAPVLDLTNVSRGAGAIGGMFGNPMLNPSLSIANAKAITMNSVSPNNGYSDTSGQNGYQSIAAEMTNIRGDLDRLNSTIAGMQVVMDSGALVGSIAPRMDNALAQRVGHAARRN